MIASLGIVGSAINLKEHGNLKCVCVCLCENLPKSWTCLVTQPYITAAQSITEGVCGMCI